MEKRKSHHLSMAARAQVPHQQRLEGFNYEPLFQPHPQSPLEAIPFLGKTLQAPFWISSMTGGTGQAGPINKNLAQAAAEFGLGMGLGSIRPLLEDKKKYFEDFNLRNLLGEKVPFFANLGIAQVEQLVENRNLRQIHDLVEELDADGLIIHINILQEWLQPEGDTIRRPPLETLMEFLQEAPYQVIVKEVGQGFGPRSLAALLKLPLSGIELGAFGGTNFSRLELERHSDDLIQEMRKDFSRVGHDAEEMLHTINQQMHNPASRVDTFIISGGIRNMLHAWRLHRICRGKSVIGRANAYLQPASHSYDELKSVIQEELAQWAFIKNFIDVVPIRS